MEKKKEASEALLEFLDFLDECERQYQTARDEVQRLELIVNFFNEQNHKNTVKKMRQLLGRQRKEEEFLRGKRTYKPRVKAD